MTTTEQKKNPFLFLGLFIVLFIAIFYGSRAFGDYRLMQRALDKVEQLEQAQAGQAEICSAIRYALDVARLTDKQKVIRELEAKKKAC